MRFLKTRYEEVIIGAVLGLGTALAVTSPLILLTHLPMPSLLDVVWPLALPADDPDRWARLPHAIVSVVGWAGVLAGGWLAARQTEEQHVRGVRYEANAESAVAALQAIEAPRMSPAQRAHTAPGVNIGGVEFSRSRETEHALVLGLPGSGKTAAVLRPMLDQALARGDRVIVHDPKGDFTATHYDPATTVLLGPWDERAHLWDGAADMDSPALIDEFAKAVCGGADAGQNKWCHEGAATVLGGLLKVPLREGKVWTWAKLATALQAEPIAMIRYAANGDPLVRQAMLGVFPNDPEFPPSLSNGERAQLSTLAIQSRMLLQLGAVDAGRPDAPRFSLRGWLTSTSHTDVKLVILNSNANYPEACDALWGSMLATISSTIVASLPEQSADASGLWMILDEAKQLGGGALEKIQTIEEVGRSRGVRVVLGLQDAQQLEASVGREKAGPMLSMQGTRYYLRAAPNAAEQIARTVGDREIKRIANTATAGAVQGKTSNYERVPVLTTSDLTGLRGTKLNDGTMDIELLVSIEDVIGKLVANSGQRKPNKAGAFEASEAWRAGLPPEAHATTPETKPETTYSLDDDLPFSLDEDSETTTESIDTDDDYDWGQP